MSATRTTAPTGNPVMVWLCLAIVLLVMTPWLGGLWLPAGAPQTGEAPLGPRWLVLTLVLAVQVGLLALIPARLLASLRAPPVPAETAFVVPDPSDALPRWQNLRCPACGGPATLDQGAATCGFCRRPIPVSDDHQAVPRFTELASRDLEQAERVVRRMAWLSSWPSIVLASVGPLIWGMLGSWVVFASGTGADMPGALAIGALLLVEAGGFGVAGFLLNVRGDVPVVLPAARGVDDADGQAGQAHACEGCGAPVPFVVGRLSALCRHCGAECLRVAFARRAHRAAAYHANQARESLREARRELMDRFDGAVLVFGYVVYLIVILVVWSLCLDISVFLSFAVCTVITMLPIGIGTWAAKPTRAP